MPKYWVKNYFAHGRFPEVGQKQKTERKKKRRERLNDGNNNGRLRIANATSGGTSKAAWAKKRERLKVGNNNGQLRIANATSGGTSKVARANILYFISFIAFNLSSV